MIPAQKMSPCPFQCLRVPAISSTAVVRDCVSPAQPGQPLSKPLSCFMFLACTSEMSLQDYSIPKFLSLLSAELFVDFQVVKNCLMYNRQKFKRKLTQYMHTVFGESSLFLSLSFSAYCAGYSILWWFKQFRWPEQTRYLSNRVGARVHTKVFDLSVFLFRIILLRKFLSVKC